MKIVDRKTFLSLPPGVVFMKYAPCHFSEVISIKGGTIGDVDFAVQYLDSTKFDDETGSFDDEILDQALKTGKSFEMDFESMGRDGLYDQDQLFAVYELKDLTYLIGRLQQCVADYPQGDEIRRYHK